MIFENPQSNLRSKVDFVPSHTAAPAPPSSSIMQPFLKLEGKNSRQRSAKRTFRDDKWLFCLLKCASSELKYPRWQESCSVNRCSLNLSAAGNDYFAAHPTFAEIAASLSPCSLTAATRASTFEFAHRARQMFIFQSYSWKSWPVSSN